MEPLQPSDPARISTYELTARLGAGGMGQVYLGRSPGGRMVAVKVIRPELTSDPEFRARFRREVVAMKAVSGFFTAPVVDADADGDPAWLATAYISGPSLAEAVRDRGPMPQSDVLVLAAGLAEALGAIHREGLTHRDLKPANVLLADDGPRVIDFGLAVSAQSSVVTQAGVVVGTPSFMSPEQINGHGVGPVSDIFSLGAVLTYAATGRAPHGEGGTMELMFRVVNNEPDLSGISGTLLHLVQACLSKDPAQRPSPTRILQVLSDGAGVQATAAVGWVPPQVALHPLPSAQIPGYGPSGQQAAYQNSGPEQTLSAQQNSGQQFMPAGHGGPGSPAAPGPQLGAGSGPHPTRPMAGAYNGGGNGAPGAVNGTPPVPFTLHQPNNAPRGYGGATPKKRSPALAIGGGVAAVAVVAGIAFAASGGGDKPTPSPTTAPVAIGSSSTTQPATSAPATKTTTAAPSDSASAPAANNKKVVIDAEKLFTAADAQQYLKAAKSDINDDPQKPDTSSTGTMTAHGWSVGDSAATDKTFLNKVFIQTLTETDQSYQTGADAALLFYTSNTKPLPSDPPFNPVQIPGLDKVSIQIRQPTSSSLQQDSLQYGSLQMLIGNVEIGVEFDEMNVPPETARADLTGIANLIATRLPK